MFSIGCYQSQNYKIWKQFTTSAKGLYCFIKLLSIAKLQNLKAIHNSFASLYPQRQVVINHKTTKFESNSQRSRALYGLASGCYQSQNYKIWKQFTTIELGGNAHQSLLSIAKLQNLKAIHNLGCRGWGGFWLLSITKLQNLKAIHNSRSCFSG